MSREPWHHSCKRPAWDHADPIPIERQELLLKGVCMRDSLYLGLLGLLFVAISCAQHPAQIRPTEAAGPDPASQSVKVTTSEVKPGPDSGPAADHSPARAPKEDKTTPVPATHPKQSTSSGQSAAKGEKDSKDVAAAPKDDPESEQKKIEEALDLYQEGVDAWSRGDWAEAIQSFDDSFQIIYNIDTDKYPDIAQQKEDLRLLISKRIVEIYASRSHLHTDLSREIPLTLNEYVAREIKSFQTVERSFFIESCYRSGMYRGYIAEQMKKAGLPEDLSWLPLIESGFKVKALSRARALGLWQFIASTGYRFDLRRDRWVDERMDLERSTQAAINYLTTLHDLFGDWTTVLAAYNCGEANVLRVIREQRVNYLDNFWDLYTRLPAETARYVPRFIASLHIIKDPEKYGFPELTVAPPLSYTKVQINKQMRLQDVALALNLSLDKLHDLNPALRNGATPDYSYRLNVTAEAAPLLASAIDQIPEWRAPKIILSRHRVRRGETISSIARKYRVSPEEILRANRLKRPRYLRPGRVLRIPREDGISTASSEDSTTRTRARHTRKTAAGKGHKGLQNAALDASSPPDGSAASVGQLAVNSRTAATDPRGEAGAQPQTIRYRVKDGDTLFGIAKRFNTTVDEIKVLNALTSNIVKVGQFIHVPNAGV
jgi:membrane-bound lytic murein transglycosylase D